MHLNHEKKMASSNSSNYMNKNELLNFKIQRFYLKRLKCSWKLNI